MDAKLFRLPTSPNLFSYQKNYYQQPASRVTVPTEDSRFPGYAAAGAADGRLVTDYRYHCETNIPVEAQEKTRVWMQQNAEVIMQISRQRNAERTGAVYGLDRSMVPPAAVLVDCAKDQCVRIQTGAINGIGVERRGDKTPDLFGTYEAGSFLPPPAARLSGTYHYEGGRNTPRGRVLT